jgi:hypothetical protein
VRFHARSATLIVFIGFAGCASDPTHRTTPPYLEIDSPDSVVVSWFTPELMLGVLEVLDPDTLQVLAAFTDDTSVQHHIIHVTGLPAGAQWLYRLTGPAATDSDLHALKTPPPSGTPLHLDVIGDTGSGLPAQYAVADRLNIDHPDYVLHAGDVVYPSGADSDYDRTVFQPYATLLDHTPILPCIGNHDVGGLLNAQPYLNNFILPENGPAGLKERCYSITLGDVILVSVDRTRDSQTIADIIIPWIRETLKQSTATWRILMFHYPVYQSGSSHHAIIQSDIDLWGPLCDEWDIDLCLSGHNHFYERSLPIRAGNVVQPGEGTVYIVSGNGGQFLYQMNDPIETSAAHDDVHYGFVRLVFTGSHLDLAEIADDGQTLDAAAWDKNSP